VSNAFQRLGELQAFVGVRADGDDRQSRGGVRGQQVFQQLQECFGFHLPFGLEQFLALIDREDQYRRLRLNVSCFLVRGGWGRFVNQRLKNRPEAGGAAVDSLFQFGAGPSEAASPASPFERQEEARLAGDHGATTPDDA